MIPYKYHALFQQVLLRLIVAVPLVVIAFNIRAAVPVNIWQAMEQFPLSSGVDHRMVVEIYRPDQLRTKLKGNFPDRPWAPIIIEPYASDENQPICFKYKSGSMDCFYAEDISEY